MRATRMDARVEDMAAASILKQAFERQAGIGRQETRAFAAAD